MFIENVIKFYYLECYCTLSLSFNKLLSYSMAYIEKLLTMAILVLYCSLLK